MMPGGARVTAETNARRQKNAGEAAKASASRYKAAKEAAASEPTAHESMRGVVALARSGDRYAEKRADGLFVNWRRGRRKAVA